MIWSSFLYESLVGPWSAPSPLCVASVSGGTGSDLERERAVISKLSGSLGLFVLVRFVCGFGAGDETLGGSRGC